MGSEEDEREGELVLVIIVSDTLWKSRSLISLKVQ